jgi:ribosome-binding factor A
MAKESKRQLQTGELIKRNMGQVLMMEGRYIYGEALVTVTNVKMSPDLGISKVYVSVYNADDKELVVKKMRSNMWRLKSGLVQRIKKHVRRIPHLDIYLDETLDEMWHLNVVFDEMRNKKQMGEDE